MSDIRFDDLGDGKFSVHGDLTYDTVARALYLSRNLFEDHATIELDLTDVGDRHNLNIFWIAGPNQHIAFIARSNDANPNGIVDLGVVKVHRAKSAA